MYRTEQCYNCKFLVECDKYYNEKTGEFEYPHFSSNWGRVDLKIKEGGVYEREGVWIETLPNRNGEDAV